MALAELFDAAWSWIAILGLPLAYVLLTPLLILMTFRQDANPQLQVVDADLPLPEEVRSFFYQSHEKFGELGYENIGTYFLPSQMENVRAILVLFANRPQMELAMSVVMYGKVNETWKIQTRYTEFLSSFANQSSICTGNQKQSGSFPIPPQNLNTIHPRIQDISTLCRAH